MSLQLVYVDTSTVREGALEELRDAIGELAGFVEESEPDLLAYNVYFTSDGSRMTVIHAHADPDSLDFHMDVAGPRFARFAELLALESIDIYGEPSERALKQLRDKVELLGRGTLTVHPLHAGFTRRPSE